MSENTTENVDVTTDAPEAPVEQPSDTDGGKDWQAEAEKWKALARKHEAGAKANADKARQFDEFTEAQKSEQQKLEERAAAAEKAAQEREAELARLQAAIEHKLDKDDLDLLKYVPADEVADYAARLAARNAAKESGRVKDFGGGDRGDDVNAKSGQLSREDIKRMTPEEITQAHAEGRFSDLLKN